MTQMALTIYLRQAGLTCSSKFCYLYSVRCWGQDAVSNSRPIANIYVGSNPKNDTGDGDTNTKRTFLKERVSVNRPRIVGEKLFAKRKERVYN
jgi:hypothetical protein